jgi:hypothetical protein
MTTRRGPHLAAAPTPRKGAAAAHPGGNFPPEASAVGLVTVQRLRFWLRLLLVIAAATVVVLALRSAG